MPSFKGHFTIDPPLTEEHRRTLIEFVQDSYSVPDTPSRSCHWIPTDDGTSLEWDGGEKFWAFKEWLIYLIDRYLSLWNYRLSGEVRYDEEYDSPIGGVLYVWDNQVEVVADMIPNPQCLPSWRH